MRIISFAWTTKPFLDGTKTVTRRLWKNPPKVGELLQAWDKSPRFHGKRIGTIRILKMDYEPLHDFELHGWDELAREGGLWKSPGEYIVRFLRDTPGMIATDYVWRIEFEKIKETADG